MSEPSERRRDGKEKQRAQDKPSFFHSTFIMSNCIFCQIIDGEEDADIVKSSENFIAFLDVNPVTEGHTLVVPREHVEKPEELDDGEILDFAIRTVQELQERYDFHDYNVGINAGETAGQTIEHLHLHVIPRREDDMEDPEGGVRGVIPEERRYS